VPGGVVEDKVSISADLALIVEEQRDEIGLPPRRLL